MSREAQVRRVEREIAARGLLSAAKAELDVEAVASGRATLSQYARVYRDEIDFRQIFFISEVGNIVSRLAEGGCGGTLIDIIGHPPDVSVGIDLEMSWGVMRAAAMKEWVRYDWWTYMCEGLASGSEEDWPARRADVAVDFLALIPPNARTDLTWPAGEASEMRGHLFVKQGGVWELAEIVQSMRDEVATCVMSPEQRAWVEGWRHALATGHSKEGICGYGPCSRPA